MNLPKTMSRKKKEINVLKKRIKACELQLKALLDEKGLKYHASAFETESTLINGRETVLAGSGVWYYVKAAIEDVRCNAAEFINDDFCSSLGLPSPKRSAGYTDVQALYLSMIVPELYPDFDDRLLKDPHLPELLFPALAHHKLKTTKKIVEDNIITLSEVDEISTKVRDSLSTVYEILTKVRDSLTAVDESLTKVRDSLSAVDELSTEVRGSLSTVEGISTGVKDSLSEVDEILTKVRDSLSEDDELSTEVRDSLSEVNEILTKVRDSLSEVDEIPTEVKDPLSTDDEILTKVRNSLSEVDEILTKARDSLSEVDGLSAELKGILSKIYALLSDVEIIVEMMSLSRRKFSGEKTLSPLLKLKADAENKAAKVSEIRRSVTKKSSIQKEVMEFQGKVRELVSKVVSEMGKYHLPISKETVRRLCLDAFTPQDRKQYVDERYKHLAAGCGDYKNRNTTLLKQAKRDVNALYDFVYELIDEFLVSYESKDDGEKSEELFNDDRLLKYLRNIIEKEV
ncbi:TPA: hypothetical protein N2898_003786 [Vibrio parahaemolyticus]|nr:hypothetical protein [Vibrio alginolyticus]HCG8548956.1 hypothetical protein [Vibrio parahaemolyticus]MCR9528859.1 hypothetical protein [Vibrio alginolyticus]HCH0772065.1 hypothetical protein [Vibrio parahaemolyticus]HCH1006792.1 hypothetical protein [Vibrio parahaemolyticus]HCM1289707.1 hypothetical protein [Vibrio parahaemolyticus]